MSSVVIGERHRGGFSCAQVALGFSRTAATPWEDKTLKGVSARISSWALLPRRPSPPSRAWVTSRTPWSPSLFESEGRLSGSDGIERIDSPGPISLAPPWSRRRPLQRADPAPGDAARVDIAIASSSYESVTARPVARSGPAVSTPPRMVPSGRGGC